MQFVQEFDILDNSTQSQIQEYLSANKDSFSPSMVYESNTDTKLVKPEKRLSTFRLITDKSLFDLSDKLVQKINEKQTDLEFILYKNDITHIKYEQGGYFKPHEDYLSLTSNIVQEYTLIMCIDSAPDTVGGETILHFNPKFSHKSKATVTPKHCLLFRKDLKHEGAKLVKGTKEIMTLNLWCVRKSDGPVVIISFPKTPGTHVIQSSKILALKDHNNVLRSYVELNKEVTVNWICEDFDYNEFQIVVDIYNGHHIPYSKYLKNQKVVDYFGFDGKNVLITDFEQGIIKEENKETMYWSPPENLSFDYLLFPNVERYQEFLRTVKKFRLRYIPFKILMAEGHAEFGGDLSVDLPEETIPMMPVWATFSERDNLMFVCNLCSKGYSHLVKRSYENSDTELLDEDTLPIFEKLKDGDRFVLHHKDDDYYCDAEKEERDALDKKDNVKRHIGSNQDGWKTQGHIMRVNLAGYSNCQNISEIIGYVMNNNWNMRCIVAKCGEKDPSEYEDKTDYYLIDNDNQLALNPEHFQNILDQIKGLDLYRTIQSELKNIPFKFPQKSGYIENDFCNEQVYGNFNFLMIYGFMSMKVKEKEQELIAS